MSSQPQPKRRTISREMIRARINSLKSSRRHGPIGPAEVVALSGSVLIFVLVIIAYIYFLVPARSRLEKVQLERARLQTQLRSSELVVQRGLSTEAIVQGITQSLDDFENNRLLGAGAGRMNLYESLNQLMRKNSLRNISGPTYTPLDPTGTKTDTGGTKSASSKWQSIYPGLAISVTVEGQYQNLRRFIRDIETSRQFVVINGVELERARETNTAAPVDGGAPGASGRSLVSLRLEMATYFQRSTAEPAGERTN